MIKTIEIQNFKSHKDSRLELSPGVNVIVGQTDSGKSAIIQALRWLIWNRPVGDSFRSNWGGKTKVEIEVDGVVSSMPNLQLRVTRLKDNNINRYILGHEKFNAIKTNIPDEIKAVLNLNEINLQTQFDSHFLLSKSAGEVASHFNRVAHLDEIDKGIFNISSWIRQINGTIAGDEVRLSKLEEELAELSYLEALQAKIIQLEYMSTKQDGISLEKKEIKGTLKQLQKIENKIEKVSRYIPAEELVNNILDKIKEVERVEDESIELVSLIVDIQEIDERIEAGEELLPAEKMVDDLLYTQDLIDTNLTKGHALETLILDLNNNHSDQQQLKYEIGRLEKQFHDELGEGKICPLCGNKIK